MGLAQGRQAVKDLAASNCEVGAAVARRVGLGFAVQEALQRSTSIVRRASIVAAADAYQAMTQERPYRPALAPVAAAEQLSADAGRGRLDGEVVRAVLTVAGHRRTRPRAAWPAGLSDREVDVLQRKACISIVTWGTAQPGGPASRSHPST
jgi:hypothetical protein